MPHIKDCEQIPVIDEQLARALEAESEPFSVKVADALDALVDGRGVGKEELAVIALCDAAPALLRALKRAADELRRAQNSNGSQWLVDEEAKARAIIAKAPSIKLN